MLLPILALVIFQKRQWRLSWVVLIPLGTIAAWSLFNYLDYGGVHIMQRSTGEGLALFSVAGRTLAWAMTLGAITPFGLIIAVRLVPLLRRWAPMVYGLTSIMFGLLVVAVAFSWMTEVESDRILRGAFLANAIIMIFATLKCLLENPTVRLSPFPCKPGAESTPLLLLWIGGHMAFYCVLAPFMAVRHVMLVLPAFLLIGAMPWPSRLPRSDAVFGLGATILLSVTLGLADWRFAAFFRDEAQTIRATLPNNAHILFAGHWGWQWYATQAGFQSVDIRHPEFKAGDFFVEPRNVVNRPIPDLPRLTLYRTDSKPLGLGDLFCTARDARFYATFSVQGPWQLTVSCGNIIDIYRVETQP